MSFLTGFPGRKRLYSNGVLRGPTPKFRLLQLQPGGWEVPLCCTLHELPLDGAPTYKALSYAWDSGTKPDEVERPSIQCNGISVPVSWNLFAALRRLRHISEPIHVWVDAICINQQDDRERTHQVQMMRDIYHKSDEVAIWLGEGDKYDDVGQDVVLPPERGADGRSCLDWKGDMSDKPLWDIFRARQEARQESIDLRTRDVFGAFCVLWLLSIGVSASEIMHLRHIAQSTTILNGLDAIRDQPWWQRVWVVQETVVARHAVVYFDKISAPWKMVAAAAANYHAERITTGIESAYPYLRSVSRFSRLVREIEGVRLTWRHQYKLVPSLPLLHQFRSRKATDPRDKVYALLGIIQQWDGPDRVIPDYQIDVKQVFWRTTVTIIKNLKCLDVLAGITRDGAANETGVLGPSWVIDWSFPVENNDKLRIFGSLPLYNASKSIPAKPVRTHGHSILELYGREFDQILNVSQDMLPSNLGEEGDTGEWRKVISEWECMVKMHYEQDTSYVGHCPIYEAFWRTICGDCEYVRNTTAAGLCRAESSLELGYQLWRSADTKRRRTTSIVGGYWQESAGVPEPSTADSVPTEKKNTFHYALECSAGGRKFFITKSGYIGLGPPDMVVGDRVFIVAGSRVPLVLRNFHDSPKCDQSVTEMILISGTQRTFFAAGSQAKGMAPQVGRGICNDLHEDCYHLVGDAYLHGIMDGEAAEKQDVELPRPVFLA